MVFAIAVLADILPASSLEINGGRIKEHQAHFAKEIALALKEGFFDHILGATRAAQHPLADLFSQPRHGPVEMLEGQVLGSWNSITLSPALGGPVAARSEKSVQHGEVNGPLHLKLITPVAEQFADDLFEAEFNPQATKNQVRANLSDGYRLGLSGRMGIEDPSAWRSEVPRGTRSSCPLASRTSSRPKVATIR